MEKQPNDLISEEIDDLFEALDSALAEIQNDSKKETKSNE